MEIIFAVVAGILVGGVLRGLLVGAGVPRQEPPDKE